MVGKRGSLAERFASKFKEGAPTECWIWQASHNGLGYGMIWDRARGRKVLATHVSYEMSSGPIPAGSLILHSCDNPACVNPAHLRVGSHKDNMADMDARCRRVAVSLKGDGSLGATLHAGDVVNLLKDYVAGTPRKEIALRYGISELSVSDYTSGKSWAHLHGKNGCPTLSQLEAAKRVTPVTEEIAREVWRLHFCGKSTSDIASHVGQSVHSVAGIVAGKTWRHLGGAPTLEELKQGGVRRGYNQFSNGGDTRAAHPKTKIPPSEIPKILARINAGETMSDIGKSYGVQKAAIFKIKKRYA